MSPLEVMVSRDSDNAAEAEPDDAGPVLRVGRLARRGVNAVVRRGVEHLKDRFRDEVVELLSSRERIETLQATMARIADWSLKRGFDADPNAALLFEFVDWLEDRHGRQTVASILLRSPMLRDPDFLDALAHLSDAVRIDHPAAEGPRWSSDRVERFKHRAGNRLLEVLVELAALESDESPPEGPATERIEYFEDAPIPDRFHRLAAMTRGEQLADRQLPHERLQRAKELFDRIRPAGAKETELARFVPGLDDETLHFLVFSTTFFLHSYLVRNLIEALPEYAGDLATLLEQQTEPDG